MSLLKYLERYKRIDDLIKRKSTGNVENFARKIGISRSQLLQDLRDLKELGAPIEFCHQRQSYTYTHNETPPLEVNLAKIKGGSFYNTEDIQYRWTLYDYLHSGRDVLQNDSFPRNPKSEKSR